MSEYVVYIKVGTEWLPISRSFEHEHQAQDWALDLDVRWTREIWRVET